MRSFLLLTTRSEDTVACAEVEAFLTHSGLLPEELRWVRADRTALDDISLDSYTGIFLAGSPFTVSAPAHEKSTAELFAEQNLSRFLDRVIAEDVPFLGVCYGIGTLGTHQGALVSDTYGESSQATQVVLSAAGARDPLFRNFPQSFTAFVGHKEAITQLPAHAVALASSAHCPVQAFRVGRAAYAVQFHPELDRAAMRSRVETYADHGYFPATAIPGILRSVAAADVLDSHRVLASFVELASNSAQEPTEARSFFSDKNAPLGAK